MRRLFVASAVIALVVAVSPIGYYLIEQAGQRAIEFVKHYKGVHGKGASISDFVSLTDLGCSCGSGGQISQSWQAEPTGRLSVWRVTVIVKTALRARELTFYTDMMTVWAGDQEAERIIEQVNVLQYTQHFCTKFVQQGQDRGVGHLRPK
jgi:hypothetical protein